jgi:hypothetical protein
VQESPPETAVETSPPIAYGPPSTSGAASSSGSADVRVMTLSRRAVAVTLSIAVAVVVAIVLTLVRLVIGAGTESATTPQAVATGQVLTDSGNRDLVDALRRATGSTTVFEVVLYPGYAMVSTPIDATTRRQESWRWDGHVLSRNNIRSTSEWGRFDMSRIDHSVIADVTEEAKHLVDHPQTWFVILRGPHRGDPPITVFVTGRDGEPARLMAKSDGTVVGNSLQGL